MKTCGACKEPKPLSAYHTLLHTSDGLNWRCIPCQNAYNRAHNLKRVIAKCHPVVWAALAAMPLDRRRKIAPKIRINATGCWEWIGNRHPGNGYPRVWFSKRDDRLAHRVVYEAVVGPIPPDLTLDHLCRVRHCVNPSHLEAVTVGENVLRGYNPLAINARKKHCLRGHAFTPENTSLLNGTRQCRECNRIRKQMYRHQARLAREAAVAASTS